MATQYPTEREEFGNEIQVLEKRIKELEKRNRELNIALMYRSAESSGYQEKSLRLEAKVVNLEDRLLVKGVAFEDKERMLLHAREEVRRLLTLIKIHKMQTGHNLCWMNDLVLWREALQNLDIQYPHDTIPPEEEFELGCEAWCKPYYRSRSNGQGKLSVGEPPAMPWYDKSK